MQAIQVSLSPNERDLLAEILRESLSDRRVEVRRTEFSSEFHDELVKQEQVVRSILDKISEASVSMVGVGP